MERATLFFTGLAITDSPGSLNVAIITQLRPADFPISPPGSNQPPNPIPSLNCASHGSVIFQALSFTVVLTFITSPLNYTSNTSEAYSHKPSLSTNLLACGLFQQATEKPSGKLAQSTS